MPQWPLPLVRATDSRVHAAEIIQLIDEAASWLALMGIDQWQKPWPTVADRDGRVKKGIRQGKTWICRDNGAAIATITADPDRDPYWSDAESAEPAEPAIYVHRLVVSRRYAGLNLGAALLDWAGSTGRDDHRARWIRVSVWTTNDRLHAYYEQQGFSPCGYHPDDGYPSSARYQKDTADIKSDGTDLLRLA